ncbi:MAG: hypothetical protein ABJG88_08995 [Litorimonas sp.]
MFKSPFQSLKATEIIAALIVMVVIGFGLASNLKNPADTNGLLQLRADGTRAYANGYTDARSVSYARKFFKKNPQITTLVLQNMSGTQDADQNLRIARNIRRLGLNTHLESDSHIASGAVDLFLAGVNRTAQCGAKIGVHSWSAGGFYDAQESYFDDRRGRQERFLRDMGIDPQFYIFTREAAPAKGLYVLTSQDIARFTVTTQAYNCPP